MHFCCAWRWSTQPCTRAVNPAPHSPVTRSTLWHENTSKPKQ